MQSGDFSVTRDDEGYRKWFSEIKDRSFVQRTYTARPALVSKKPVNGHRMWKDYKGEPFDESEYDLVDGLWDHEHCSICFFKITEEFTYWENAKRIKLLCDACHEAFARPH